MTVASCIMPTRNRRTFARRAIDLFLAQDVNDLELVILDDGEDSIANIVPNDTRIRYLRREQRLSVGEKRNLLCAEARGEYIVHWDDDDWYPADRVRRQLEVFRTHSADACGSSTLYYYDPAAQRAWRYRYAGARPYVTGNSLVYRRSFWAKVRFADLQVGEDTRFVQAVPAGRLFDMKDPTLCVATIHAHNVSPKRPGSSSWLNVDVATIQELITKMMGDIAPSDCATQTQVTRLPRVSCIMPTGNRRAFASISLELFESQDYLNRELVVVDGGEPQIADLCEGRQHVRYVRAPQRSSIGARRNLACLHATGEIIIHWDDDDWYGRDRIRLQVEPIIEGRADVTGLKNEYTLQLDTHTFWAMSAELHRRMFVGDVHGGTLAFRRSYFDMGIRYPDVNLAEDAAFLRRAQQAGARLLAVQNQGSFVYVRHGSNAWNFECGDFPQHPSWQATERPRSMPEELIGRYQSAHHDTQPVNHAVRHATARQLTARRPHAEGIVDCLGATVLPQAELVCERCIAIAASERYAEMLDAALLSLSRSGDVADALRVILIVGTAPACERVAARHGAYVLRCPALRAPGPAIKAALYSIAQVVRARQYLCLDADVLVLNSLREMFEQHAAAKSGRILIAAEATHASVEALGDAIVSIYAGTSIERAQLTEGDARIDGYPLVVNDGVFVADRDALLAIDEFLRSSAHVRAWVFARRDVWWRQKAALNLALARTDTAIALDPMYNVQLHIESEVPKNARVLHFNGTGRNALTVWRRIALGSVGSDQGGASV